MEVDHLCSRNIETNKKPAQMEIQHWSPHFPLLNVHWGQNMWKAQSINTKPSKQNIWSHCCILTFPNDQISPENRTMLKFPKALFSPAFITNPRTAPVYPQTGDVTQALQRALQLHTCKTQSIYRLWLYTCFSHPLSPLGFLPFFYCNRTMPVQISADWTCCFTSPLPWADLDERIEKELFTLCWHLEVSHAFLPSTYVF